MEDSIALKIKHQIEKMFRYDISFVEDDWSAWNLVLETSCYVPVEYSPMSIKYQNAYIRCFYEDVINLFVLIMVNGKPISVWPITVYRNNDMWHISSNEKEVLPPFFTSGVTYKMIKSVNESAINTIELIHTMLNTLGKCAIKWQTRVGLFGDPESGGGADWYRRCMIKGGSTDVITDLYVNLALPIDEIHSHVRKHYKALINKAQILWNVEVFDNVTPEFFEEFRFNHIKIANRETRSKETWEIQYDMVNMGEGFCVKLTDKQGNTVGMSLFQCTRDEGLYSTGVYDRSLFDQPVSHLAQWVAIRHMKEKGLKYYKIGQRYYSGKTMWLPKPTEKELSISYFKEGFATDYYQTLVVTFAD